MKKDHEIDSDTNQRLIANRYEVIKRLGKGGMSIAYHVWDTHAKRNLALKQLVDKPQSKRGAKERAFFEQEYYTLAQLAHPRIVQVFDYGLDNSGAYYTMELLDGGDMRQLSPLPWKKACSLLRDICSAISLLHSRKKVHRDLTPRNIRCTGDEKAKLIDFGAMMPMGPCKNVVGTPSFTAPEVVNNLSLDARTDIYSLGATAYFALTGRRAFRARKFEDLREAWRSQPFPPSDYEKDIPKELDALIFSMLSINPAARPVSAAEVIERLSAIAGLEHREQLVIARSYLNTPNLVGRKKEVDQMRRQILRAVNGTGSTAAITGPAGVGRSRLLDAHVLEAKLAGALVIRVDASDSIRGPWSAANRLMARVCKAIPIDAREAAGPHLDTLAHLFPEIRLPPSTQSEEDSSNPTNDGGDADFPDIQESLRPQIQTAMKSWLTEISKRTLLFIAVDDVHQLDEPSTALLAFLSRQFSGHRLVISVTLKKGETTTAAAATKLLLEADLLIVLENLNPAEIQALLESVFGDVPNAQLLSRKIHAISGGSPRASMQLAQHLMDQGIAHYRQGTWYLPSSINDRDLPANITEALKKCIDGLGADARHLLDCVSLAPKEIFTLGELQSLTEHGESSRLLYSVDELLAAEILTLHDDRYGIAQKGWTSALETEKDCDRLRTSHLRLADIYLSRTKKDTFRATRHLLKAGKEERAIDLLTKSCEATRRVTDQNPQAYSEFIQSRPDEWQDIFRTTIRLAKSRGNTRRQIFALQERFCSMGTVVGASGDALHFKDILKQLVRDAGLDIYNELDQTLDSAERLQKAFALAQTRHEATPEDKRGFPPQKAVPELGRMILISVGQWVVAHDYTTLESIPSLGPLVSLSPALGLTEDLVQSVRARIAGRLEIALEGYKRLVARMEMPDRAGLSPGVYTNTRSALIRGLGFLESIMGLKTCLNQAAKIENQRGYERSSLLIQMLYHLWQGDTEQSDRCKQQMELLQIRQHQTQLYRGSHWNYSLVAHGLTDNLRGIIQSIDDIEEMVARFKEWESILHFAKAEYQRVRGDYPRAIEEIRMALQATAPGRHPNWANMAGTYLNTLLAAEQYLEALHIGRELLGSAENENLGYTMNYIKMPLALAEAETGGFERAQELASSAIDSFHSIGTSGLNLGLAYETRARVAIAMGNNEAFQIHTGLFCEQLAKVEGSSLLKKYESLVRAGRKAGLDLSADLLGAAGLLKREAEVDTAMVEAVLKQHSRYRERIQYALNMLVDSCECSGGVLYLVHNEKFVLSATNGDCSSTPELEELVRSYINEQILEDLEDTKTMTPEEVTGMGTEESIFWTKESGEQLVPLVLRHHAKNGYAITGLAVLLFREMREPIIPAGLTMALSRFLDDFGDVSVIYRN